MTPCPICTDTGLLPEDDPTDETFCSCERGQTLQADEDAWADWRNPPPTTWDEPHRGK